MRSSFMVRVAWSGLFLATAAAADGVGDPPPVTDRIFGLSLIWQEANYNFAFFDLNPDLDWDAEYRRALGRVIATTTTWEYVREAQRFVALLGEAHSNVEPGRELRARFGAEPPVELEEIERRAVVVNTTRDLSAELPPGSEILRVDGRTIASVLEEDVFPCLSASTEAYRWRQAIRGHPWRSVGLLVGETGSRVVLTIVAPDIEVAETLAAWRTGRDLVLERAVEELRESVAP